MEVEETLREIRERVRAEVKARASERPAVESALTLVPSPVAHEADGAPEMSDALARLEANLATAERAWNKLPPLMSYRRGWLARLELWLKRQIKRATHWYTWEQVNFNAAVNHSLRDTRAALEACRQQLDALQTAQQAEASARGQLFAELEARLNSAVEARGEEVRLLGNELHTIAGSLEARLDSNSARLNQLTAALNELSSAHESLRGDQRAIEETRVALQALAEKAREEMQTVADETRKELRERIGHVLEEQRVSIRQLSIESTERAVTQDRARRRIEQRLEEISKAVISDK